ncbi:MAG: outer membrane protein assembly factor BamB [Burkholderiaceae bacterium]|nr:outer membrane protein assembly factor BamB [Burkholderiaceae bacterium]
MRIAVKLAYVAAAVVTMAALAGCSMFHKDPPKNPPATLTEFKPTLTVHKAWSMSIGSSDDFSFSPAYAEGSVFAAAADGTIVRLAAGSGKLQWRIRAEMPLTAGVGSDGSTVAVAGEKGIVLAYDGEGKLRWKAQSTSEILSAPAVGSGLVVVRSADDKIVAYDAESGSKRWTVVRTVPALTLRTTPGITIDRQTVFVGLPGGHLLALFVNSGAARWELAVGEPRGATELERVADLSGAPTVINGDVCAVSFQGRIGCFDGGSGNPLWTKNLSSSVGLGADERFVFAADEHGVLSAYARESGSNAWTSKVLGYRNLSAPASFGRAVAVGDYQGYVHFLSREDGAMLARVATDGSAIVAAPVVAGDDLVFQTRGGTLAAYTAE